MDIFDILNLIGGLSLFLFGMNLMGQALERRAGSSLKMLVAKMTTNRFTGLITGLVVTAIIQSSSATTVMVVGFVNSGIMTLKQAINVIMGANIGTTVTAWILSLAGIESSNVFMRLLKPSSFTPMLALIGIVYYMFSKRDKKKDTGVILLGFAVLMYGMEAMSSSVSGLSEVPQFAQLFLLFKNPVLGVLAGAALTAIIQSSSASVGILQALATTGGISYGAAVPIIMGQNIGTCITAILSSFGTNKNAKRAAVVHLSFNIIGTLVWLSVFCIVKLLFAPALFDQSADMFGIAVAHSIFNLLCVVLLFPMAGILERLVCHIVPDNEEPDTITKLDERLLSAPALALDQCRNQLLKMSAYSLEAMRDGLSCITRYDEDKINNIKKLEDKTDHYEDLLNNYLIKLSSRQINEDDSATAAKYLKLIGDFERIADHGLNMADSAEEILDKKLSFSVEANRDLRVIFDAVIEIMGLAEKAFKDNDMSAAFSVEPLEQNIDLLKEEIRSRHIIRLQKGGCSADSGFVLNDILTNLERVADHCSNIAVCIIESKNNKLDMHEALREMRTDDENYREKFREYGRKYRLSAF